MKHSKPIASLLMVCAQTFLFFAGWDWITDKTHRAQFNLEDYKGFELTLHGGAILAILSFIALSLKSVMPQKYPNLLIVVSCLLVLWTLWILPAFSDHPNLAVSLFLLGATLLIFGAVLIQVLSVQLQSRVKAILIFGAVVILVFTYVYYQSGLALRHRLQGRWSASDPETYVDVSWNGECRFNIQNFHFTGRGEFMRDRNLFRVYFSPPGRKHKCPLALEVQPETMDGFKLPRNEVFVDILEVEPFVWGRIHWENLKK